MASTKIWQVKFVVGNPETFRNVRLTPNGPFTKAVALETLAVYERNGWRGWIENGAGNRLAQTSTETAYLAAQGTQAV